MLTFGGFCKRSAYCNDWPACGNRQTTKRSAAAKQMHEATGLTVLALLLTLFSQRPSCELPGIWQQSVNERNERTVCWLSLCKMKFMELEDCE